MAKQHLTMLAHPYKPEKHGPGGQLASEKLDGQRCLLIPGTRGLLKADVPFANHDKDSRYLEEQVCSGLWSRYGNVIHAPDYWLDDLPLTFLDGELWLRRGTGGRQDLSRIIKPLVPDEEAWEDVTYRCFDMPAPETLLRDRVVNLTNYKKDFEGVLDWWECSEVVLDYRPKPGTPFRSTYVVLKRMLADCEYAFAHKQIQLSFSTEIAKAEIEGMIDAIEDSGGEGLIIRHPDRPYVTERSHSLLKVKSLSDDEATVTGYTTGRETDKGSKLLGLMGALVLDYNGKRFELSGFTDLERKLGVRKSHADEPLPDDEATHWAKHNPGEDCPDWIEATAFPRGSQVTFRYRDLTLDGLPNEGRYWRKKEAE